MRRWVETSARFDVAAAWLAVLAIMSVTHGSPWLALIQSAACCLFLAIGHLVRP